MKTLNIIFCFLLVACASTERINKTDSSYTDEQINQFCMIGSLILDQSYTRIEGERITKDLLEQYSVSEERFGEIVRSQILGSMIQTLPNELKMFNELKNKNHKLSEEKLENEYELIKSNGMNPTLYYNILQDYERSTSFQNKVYKTCQNS